MQMPNVANLAPRPTARFHLANLMALYQSLCLFWKLYDTYN